MSKAYYRLYVENTLQLAETIVVKSERTADVINDYIVKNYGGAYVDYGDPTTWKYYQNICGIYHTTDKPITITSLDTAQEIVFSKDNLELHPATARAYRYGSRYYRELLLEYPDQEMLILGILYPADMAKAVSAQDGSVLSYPSYLVEPDEVSLIPNIEKWTRKYRIRYYIKAFNNNNELFDPGHQGVMFQMLVLHILNLRTHACKTEEVHSFHIREYLASHGMLDRYLDAMTRKQALFFYRNIAYIERNSGKQDTFNWLVQKVLTDRNLPLAEYTMRHNTSNIVNEFYPQVSFKTKSLNGVFSDVDETTSYTIDDVLAKEAPLAPDNFYFAQTNRNKINELFIDSLSSVVQTKMLECSVTDYSDSSKYSRQDIALNNWAYMSKIGLYTAVVRINNPKTGGEIVLTARDAYVYFIYSLIKTVNSTYQYIPTMGALRVNPIPPVTLAQLKNFCDSNYVEDSTLQVILDNKVPLISIGSTDVFSEFVDKLFTSSEFEVGMMSLQENEYARGLVEMAVNNTYINPPLQFEPVSKTWGAWLDEKSLPDDFTQVEWREIFKRLFESATGVDTQSTGGVSALQKAMIGIMTQVSSYSIQFVSDINAEGIRPIYWSMIRIGDIDTSIDSDIHIYDTRIDVLDTIDIEIESNLDIPITPVVVQPEVSIETQDEIEIELPVKVHADEMSNISDYDLSIGSPMIELDPAPDWGNAPIRYLPSYQPFYDLTEEEKKHLKDIYTNLPVVRENTKLDIADILVRDKLMGLQYLNIKSIFIKSFTYKFIPTNLEYAIKPIIDAELGPFIHMGGRGDVPGYTYIGYTTTIDGLKYDGVELSVPGLYFNRYETTFPYEALPQLAGIGLSLPEIAIYKSNVTLSFNSVFRDATLHIKYLRDTASLPQLIFISQHFSFLPNEPFWSDPASYNHPHYTLGSFIVDVNNKVDFDPIV